MKVYRRLDMDLHTLHFGSQSILHLRFYRTTLDTFGGTCQDDVSYRHTSQHHCDQLVRALRIMQIHIRTSHSSRSVQGTKDKSFKVFILNYHRLPPRTPSIKIPMVIQSLALKSHDLARYQYGPTVPSQYSLHLHLDTISKDPSTCC